MATSKPKATGCLPENMFPPLPPEQKKGGCWSLVDGLEKRSNKKPRLVSSLSAPPPQKKLRRASELIPVDAAVVVRVGARFQAGLEDFLKNQ